jgi:hypothetical protein
MRIVQGSLRCAIPHVIGSLRHAQRTTAALTKHTASYRACALCKVLSDAQNHMLSVHYGTLSPLPRPPPRTHHHTSAEASNKNTGIALLSFYSFHCAVFSIHCAVFFSKARELPQRMPRHSLQHPVLKRPRPMTLPQCDRPSVTPHKTTRPITLTQVII